MTMLKAIGFEFNTLNETDGYGGGTIGSMVVSTEQYRGGANSVKFICYFAMNFGHWFRVALGLSEFYAQIAIYPTVNGDATYSQIAKWQKLGVTLGGLSVDDSGYIKAYTGNFVTLIGTSGTALNLNAWNVIEMHLKIADGTDGILQVKLNGTTVIDGTSIDTKPGAETEADFLVITGIRNAASNPCYYDDIVVNDVNGSVNNSWPNGLNIILLKPTADGTYQEWARSAGSDNYALVDELPPVVADYVTAGSDGLRDTYTIEDCPAGMGPIAAVIPTYWAQISGAPACANLKRLMRSGGVDEVSADITLPNAFGLIQEVLELSPFTSMLFTVAEINGLEFGQQSAT